MSYRPISPSLAGRESYEVERISRFLRDYLRQYGKRGYVVGLSGGVDSSVTCALACAAIGSDRVRCLIMPDRDSDPSSRHLAMDLAAQLQVRCEEFEITDVLAALGAYAARDEAVAQTVPEFGAGWSFKLVIPPLNKGVGFRLPQLVVADPSGITQSHELSASQFRRIVAATNHKQRVRKLREYYLADSLGYAVLGTPNILEFDQGFFVKLGDGAADVKPIAHLYKAEVYDLARYLGLPNAIAERQPTTDTYSLAQSQEEFFFGVSIEVLDAVLWAYSRSIPIAEVAESLHLSELHISNIVADIEHKRSLARYLHMGPVTMETEAFPTPSY